MLLPLTNQRMKTTEFIVKEAYAVSQNWCRCAPYKGYLYAPRPHSGFVIVASEACLKFKTVRGETLYANKGDVVYIPRGTNYSVSFSYPNGGMFAGTDSYTLHFDLTDERGEEIFFSDKIEAVLRENCGEAEICASELSRATIFEPKNILKRNAKFLNFLDAVASSVQKAALPYGAIARGVELLEKEWNKNEKIDKYARLCGVSESYFYRLFRLWAKISPVQYRNRIRINNAKILLQNTAASVAKIAGETGYEDPLYFSTAFKKAVGVSPQKYREAD